MQLLSQHIEFLLTRHDCVILPGFGAFIAETRCAEFDAEKRAFLPPRRNVSFNSAVISDDGLIAHSVARKERITFEEGRKIVEQRIMLLREQLDRETVTIGKVGTLSKKADGRIIFEAFASSIREERRGLVSFSLPSPAGQRSDNSRSNSNLEKENEAALPHRSNKYYTLRVPKTFVRVAASIAIVFCTVLSLIVPASNTERNAYKASMVEVESLFRKETKSTPKIVADQKPAEENVSDKQESDRFYLIVGTFPTEAQAKRFIASNQSQELKIANESGRPWRVSIESSSSKEELQNKLNKSQFRSEYPGAWIWEKK